ncbi:MAG TPA: histidine phosphatase family protein [Phycisphaerales bacterium]|nr:histidine phosphatase family protein [Phycisphaerales bacterium]
MRSGRTEWDLLGRVQGAADLPLTRSGLTAVQGQTTGLISHKLNSIVCAPDEASRATAELLKKATSCRRLTVSPELGEMALGLWEGLRYEELENRYCRAGRQFLTDPSGVLVPEGEAFEDYSDKIRSALAGVMARQKRGATVGVVVRPIALGVMRCLLNSADLGQLWAMLSDRPDVEWYQLSNNDPRLVAPPRRPRRSASAA